MEKPERIHLRWAIFGLAILAITYIVNAMDRLVFPVLLTAVKAEYGFSLAAGGLLATIFTLGLGWAAFPAAISSNAGRERRSPSLASLSIQPARS